MEENEQRMLSKSQINLFLQCPYRWKLKYIDRLPEPPNRFQKRGINVHEKIENFYSSVQLEKVGGAIPKIKSKYEKDKTMKNFINFEKNRIKSCVDKNKEFKLDFFKPVFQEMKVSSGVLSLRGFIDAVYRHPKGGLIIIDWKTGKYSPSKAKKMRFELAVYKLLLDEDKRIMEDVKYWGIYFTDVDKLFFEKIKPEYVKKARDKIAKVREEMLSGNYKAKPSYFCRWCHYTNKCPYWKR